MTDGIREEVVEKLLLGLPTDANGAERAFARSTAASFAQHLQRESLLPTGRKIEDATLRELTALAAIYGILERWWPGASLRNLTLGNVLKVVPSDVAEDVRFFLNHAGYIDDPTARHPLQRMSDDVCGDDP